MKRKSIWVSFICCTLVVITMAYQNCNNKKFNVTAANNLKGSLDTMSSGGEIKGEVEVSMCSTEALREQNDCPDSVKVKFYAIEANLAKTFIGQIEAELEERTNGEGQKVFVYVFVFIVAAEHSCKKVEAYAVDPITLAEVLIHPDASFILWGGDTECEDFVPEDPPVDSAKAFVQIDGVRQDKDNNGAPINRLVEVYGKCSGTANVVFSGDLNSLINKADACSNKTFTHCDFLSKDAATNSLKAKQIIGTSSDEDTVDVTGGDPILALTFDSFAKDAANNKKITITGKCTPMSQVKLSIYNAPAGTVSCSSLGTYSYSGTPLIAGLTNRIMNAELVSLFGNVSIKYDVDGEATQPACSISSTAGRGGFCTKQAGTVNGTCYTGLPVQLKVNGNYQNIGYCVGGSYSIKNVLLEKVGQNNTISIEQRTPYGKSCTASKVLTTF